MRSSLPKRAGGVGTRVIGITAAVSTAAGTENLIAFAETMMRTRVSRVLPAATAFISQAVAP